MTSNEITVHIALGSNLGNPENFLEEAREALRKGRGWPIVLNASNEIAVTAFMEKKIGFLDITKVVEKALEKFLGNKISSLEDVYSVDEEVRSFAANLIKMKLFL